MSELTGYLLTFPDKIFINIKEPIDRAINYMLKNWDPVFDLISAILRSLLKGIGTVVELIPWWLLLAAVFFAGYKISGKISRALYILLCFFL